MLSRARSPALLRTARLASATLAPRSRIPTAASALAIWMRGMADTKKPQNKTPSRPNPHEPSPPPPSQTSDNATSKGPPSTPPPTEPGPSPSSSQTPEAPERKPDLSSLPDLTQGIPSTLEREMSGATNKAALEAMQEEPEPATGAGGRGRGELPASAYVSSTDRRRNRMFKFMYLSSVALALGGVAYLGRNWESEEEAKAHGDIPNGWSPGLWWKRAVARQSGILDYYREPAFDKLLPDPDPMFERPYTLCISLEDMLVHSEWTREHGWRVAKRPGVDYFLRYLSQYYELVLFTSVPYAMGEPLVRKLDPFRFIVWPLFREATKYKDGEVVKDLSYLNRDLSKVIIIDTKPAHVQNQPENAIILPPWKGDPKDTELVSLIPFLEYVHTMQYKDVRKVLKSFEGKHIPTEFARREAIARAEFNKQLEQERRKGSRTSGMGTLGNMLGLKPSKMSMMVPVEGEQSQLEAFSQGKMLQDIARERGRRNYELLEKEIRENGEKWLKDEQAAQEKAQAEAMSSMKSSFMGWFGPPSGSPASDNANKK
ncbi:hypothetical protein DL764_005910 [Monosporascus ibericus]|uniref:Mitochondrial import inner membrane translocase subunit TIM50 n=1 Tax=Monosporascus ibericus TaxID=155417 RepID=A0A4Q4TAT0_9PEZI|nr:hypothetical protein DL764_005910 [Monosporascus ibericus]